MTTPGGEHRGGAARDIGFSVGKGAVLIGVAVIIGFVLLRVTDGGSPSGGDEAAKPTTPTTKKESATTVPATTTTVATAAALACHEVARRRHR